MIAIHPGCTIRDELTERGWTQLDLAAVTGRSAEHLNRIINGKAGISVDMATRLGAAFGTSAEFWLRLWGAYRLVKLEEMT